MIFPSSAAANAAYRAGKHDDALVIAEQILAKDPYNVDAHLVTGLIRIRRDDSAGAIAKLKDCIGLRPVEWLVERLRGDFQMLGTPPLRREMVFRLGGLLRSRLKTLGPALPPQHRRADPNFINVVGSSYVRSFGISTVFFPLFIGQGPTTLLLTESEAAITQRKFRENLKRVDGRRNTLLITGADPYYYIINLLKAGGARPNGALPQDFAMMDAAAERHRTILTEAKALISGELILLGATPTYDDVINTLSKRLNVQLKVLCDEVGVTFLDMWDALTDPATGQLRDTDCAKAYPGDIHFSRQATEKIMQALQSGGYLPLETAPADYEWTHVFECRVDASELTRIWNEPAVTVKNIARSHKIAASHVSASLADLLTCLATERPDQTLLMINVRDGHLATAVPPQVQAGCWAFTDTVENLQAGRQVLDFYGRSDVILQLSDDLAQLEGQTFSRVVLQIHPASVEADEARCNEVLRTLGPAPSVIIATPFPDRIGKLDFGGRKPVVVNVSNEHIPAEWHNYSIMVVR
jgi:hypothetical protein